MPDRHFYLLRHHILFYIYFWFFVYWCQIEINILIWRKRSLSRRLWVYDFCILNTLRSRIWDMPVFLFSDYTKPTVGENGGFSRKIWLSGKSNSKKRHLYKEFYFFCRYPLLFSYGETVLWLKTIDFWAIPSPFKIKILISIWSQRTENQK